MLENRSRLEADGNVTRGPAGGAAAAARLPGPRGAGVPARRLPAATPFMNLRRRVGPQRAVSFGLRAHVDQAEVRNLLLGYCDVSGSVAKSGSLAPAQSEDGGYAGAGHPGSRGPRGPPRRPRVSPNFPSS